VRQEWRRRNGNGKKEENVEESLDDRKAEIEETTKKEITQKYV
jgi:hypothetical protein